MPYAKRPKPVDRRAIDAWRTQKHFLSRGSLTQLASHLDISLPAVSKWPYVPRDRLTATAGFLGVEPRELRPDLFPASSPWDELLS